MSLALPALDWIFLGVLLVSLLLGAWRGLVYEILSALTWIAAFFLAQWLALGIAQKLPLSDASESVQYAAGFVLVFVMAIFVGGLLARVVKKLFAAVGLRPADRALGAAFGLIRGLIFILVAALLIGKTALHEDKWWQESVGAGMTVAALKGLKPVLPEAFGKYLLP